MWSFLVLGLFLQKGLTQTQQFCYFPNGTPDPTGVPCNTSAEESHCCSSRGLCLSNGLCFLQTPTYSNRISRQSCTDRSWKSANCPQFCADTYVGQGTTIWLGPENPNGAFCCGQPYSVTSDQCVLGTQGSTQPFNLPAGYVYFDREGKNSSDPAAFGAVSATSTAAGSVDPSTATALAAAPTSADKEDGGSHCNESAVGAGVGVPLGVLLILAVGLSIWQWRKGRLLQKRLEIMDAQQGFAAQQVNQPYKYGPNSTWGSAMASPSPVYSGPIKSGAPGEGPMEPSEGAGVGELSATQQEIPELGGE